MSSWKWQKWEDEKWGKDRWDSKDAHGESEAPAAYLGPIPLGPEVQYLTVAERQSIRDEFCVSAAVRGGRSQRTTSLTLSGPGKFLEPARLRALEFLRASAANPSKPESAPMEGAEASHGKGKGYNRQIADLQTQVLRLQTELMNVQSGNQQASEHACSAQSAAAAADYAWRQTSLLCHQLQQTMLQQQQILRQQTEELNSMKAWIVQKEQQLSNKKRQLSPEKFTKSPDGNNDSEDYSSYSSDGENKTVQGQKASKAASVAATDVADEEILAFKDWFFLLLEEYVF